MNNIHDREPYLYTISDKRCAAVLAIISTIIIVITIVVMAIWMRTEIYIIKNDRDSECMAIPITVAISCIFHLTIIIYAINIIKDQEYIIDHQSAGWLIYATLSSATVMFIGVFIQNIVHFVIVAETPVEIIYCIYQWVFTIFQIIIGFSCIIYMPVRWLFEQCLNQEFINGCKNFFTGCGQIFGNVLLVEHNNNNNNEQIPFELLQQQHENLHISIPNGQNIAVYDQQQEGCISVTHTQHDNSDISAEGQ